MHTEQLGGRICVDRLTNRWADNLFLLNETAEAVTLIY